MTRVVVLMDVSGSMQSFELEDSIKELLKEIPPGVSVAYGVFSKKSLFTEKFTSDPGELRALVDRVTTQYQLTRPGSGTAMVDAIHEALKLLEPPQAGDAIILASDGGDNSGHVSMSDIEREFQSRPVRLFVFLPGRPGNSVSPDEATSLNWLFTMAERTGGAAYPNFASNIRDWGWNRFMFMKAMKAFWLEGIPNTYVGVVGVPNSVKKPATWKLQLSKDAETKWVRPAIWYPTQLRPCGGPPTAAHEKALGRGTSAVAKFKPPPIPTPRQSSSWLQCRMRCVLPGLRPSRRRRW